MNLGSPNIWAVLTPLLAILLASCSSNRAVLMPDRFDTESLEDGSKRFVFEVNDGPAARWEQARARALSQDNMESALEVYFEQYPFCEKGYFVYDQGFNGRAYTILGECQESANASGK